MLSAKKDRKIENSKTPGKLYRPICMTHFAVMPLCVPFGCCDLGIGIMPDGSKIWITWGRNLEPKEQDYWRRKGFDLALNPFNETDCEFVIADRHAEFLKKTFTIKT